MRWADEKCDTTSSAAPAVIVRARALSPVSGKIDVMQSLLRTLHQQSEPDVRDAQIVQVMSLLAYRVINVCTCTTKTLAVHVHHQHSVRGDCHAACGHVDH